MIARGAGHQAAGREPARRLLRVPGADYDDAQRPSRRLASRGKHGVAESSDSGARGASSARLEGAPPQCPTRHPKGGAARGMRPRKRRSYRSGAPVVAAQASNHRDQSRSTRTFPGWEGFGKSPVNVEFPRWQQRGAPDRPRRLQERPRRARRQRGDPVHQLENRFLSPQQTEKAQTHRTSETAAPRSAPRSAAAKSSSLEQAAGAPSHALRRAAIRPPPPQAISALVVMTCASSCLRARTVGRPATTPCGAGARARPPRTRRQRPGQFDILECGLDHLPRPRHGYASQARTQHDEIKG